MDRKTQLNTWYVVVAVLAVLAIQRSRFLTTRVEPELSEKLAVRELIAAAFEKASAVLRRNRGQLDEGAKRLLEKETLTREELPALQGLGE